jgi:hypothetical protein
MPPPPDLLRRDPRPGRWLLPWISALLVSASLAYVMNSLVTNSPVTHDGHRHEISRTLLVASLPSPDAVAVDNDSQERGPSCTSLFGSYDSRLFSHRQSPCGLGPDATTPIPVQLPCGRPC